LPLPKAITAHGWLLFEDSKMSKSKGNIVRTETILDAFGDEVYGKQFPESTKADRNLFAADVLRYFLLREIPFGQDGTFSFDALITRYNADLANGYGNLVSRTLGLILQNFSSAEVVGSPREAARIPPLSTGNDELARTFSPSLEAATSKLTDFFRKNQDDSPFQTQLQHLSDYIQQVDVFINDEKPWKLASALRSSADQVDGNPQTQIESESGMSDMAGRLQCVLYTAAESIRIITALLYPILPYATARVWAQLGLGDIEQAASNGDLKNPKWGGLKPGTKLGPLSPIFPRADKGLAQIMTEKENPIPRTTENSQRLAENEQRTTTTDPAAPPRPISTIEPGAPLPVGGSSAHSSGPTQEPSHADTLPSAPFHTVASQTPITAVHADASPQIAIDDFAKIELRVAQILVAERIPKADKLLRLEVDLGHEKRQILSGIAEWYTPEELIGRRIVVITNLAPRKMRGLESHGMLLAASNSEGGKPILATFAEDIALGSRLK
jgi:methionyl-tRNA synthetase